MNEVEVTPEEVEKVYDQLNKEAQEGGYHLNPNEEFAKDLVWGLLTCEKRYGYRACPCRLASGVKEEDLDIICPCDYRDPDLDVYGACYCALYVSQEVLDGKKELGSIPERRPPLEDRRKAKAATAESGRAIGTLPLPVWRCKVCGYLCAREGPPEVCPVCKAKKDRFERFI